MEKLPVVSAFTPRADPFILIVAEGTGALSSPFIFPEMIVWAKMLPAAMMKMRMKIDRFIGYRFVAETKLETAIADFFVE
jgi:hypothetical protein